MDKTGQVHGSSPKSIYGLVPVKCNFKLNVQIRFRIVVQYLICSLMDIFDMKIVS